MKGEEQNHISVYSIVMSSFSRHFQYDDDTESPRSKLSDVKTTANICNYQFYTFTAILFEKHKQKPAPPIFIHTKGNRKMQREIQRFNRNMKNESKFGESLRMHCVHSIK